MVVFDEEESGPTIVVDNSRRYNDDIQNKPGSYSVTIRDATLTEYDQISLALYDDPCTTHVDSVTVTATLKNDGGGTPAP